MEWSILTQSLFVCHDNELIATVCVLNTDDGETESEVATCVLQQIPHITAYSSDHNGTRFWLQHS